MAAQSAARIQTATLTPASADTVTITDPVRAFEIVHHGDVNSAIYFRVGRATVPTAVVAADENEVVLAGERIRVQCSPQRASEDQMISLISAGAATYSVIGLL